FAPIAIAVGRSEATGHVPIGEAIDRATKLLRPAGPGLIMTGPDGAPPIRIDDVTAGLLDARFAVAGDTAGLCLLGVREHEAPRTLLGRPTPCVGREAELDRLTALFAASVKEPRAQVALVTAPPGVGKSRLRQEFVRRIREQHPGVEVWMG